MSSRNLKRPPAPKTKLVQFHIMRVGATPARLLGMVEATDEKAALARAVEQYIRPVDSPAADRPACRLRTGIDAEKNKRHRYTRTVFGSKDRRFPKRDPEIQAMYPGHLLPSSPQMLEELLRRSLELELFMCEKARWLIAFARRRVIVTAHL
jgi:hypothetical protein